MAVPLFAPLVALKPIIKVLALGSIKFIAIGIGAAVAPVVTANFLVGLSAGTPLKYARFRHKKGLLTAEELETVKAANQLIQTSIENKEQHLNRSEAREFLKEVLLNTASTMKNSVTSIPAQLLGFGRLLKTFITKPFTSKRRDS